MASIRDIAVHARVSIGTVDRVLHHRGRVSEKTRSRVERIVTELGYTPNIYARNLSLGKDFQFGVLIPRLNQDSGYWRIPAKGINRAHQQLGAAKVEVLYFYFDRYSEASFERAFHKAVHAGLDGLLIAPVLPGVARTLISVAPPKCPYVFFDTTIPELKPLASIGQDAYQSGILAASLMSRKRCADGAVAVVKVIPGDYHIEERLRGFRSGMRALPSVFVREYCADSHGGDVAFQDVAQRIVAENRNLVGIFVSNAWTHPFAQYFNKSRTGNQLCVIGYDLVAKNQKLLEAGFIDFLISQRPGMQGFEGINSLYRNVVMRDEVAQTVMVPLDIITKDNIQYYQD